MDQEARRGEEGVSQHLRALRIADHSAFLPSCLPACLIHRNRVPFPPLAQKPGRVEGGGERREKPGRVGRDELQAV